MTSTPLVALAWGNANSANRHVHHVHNATSLDELTMSGFNDARSPRPEAGQEILRGPSSGKANMGACEATLSFWECLELSRPPCAAPGLKGKGISYRVERCGRSVG